MRDYEHDLSGAEPERRPTVRAGEHDDATLLRAAAAGRPDVLGTSGALRVQRLVGNEGLTAAQSPASEPDVLGVLEKSGEPLPGEVRQDMEQRMGQDFSDVRVHRDAQADGAARSVQANAYTVGSHVVFQRDAYDPGSPGGAETLAHELHHVVQQRQGPVDGTTTDGGYAMSDPGDRHEREASSVAKQVMGQPAAVQRQEEEEEALQTQAVDSAGAVVQRQEEPEEELAM